MSVITDKAEELLGTCESYDTSDMTQAECEEFDQVAMCCSTCGWWVCPDEVDVEGNCGDCNGVAELEED